MKKFLLLILLLIPIPLFAASNPYPRTQEFNGYISTPCTTVVWQEVYNRLGIALPGGWGDAVNWLRNASNDGYKIGSEAKANSIAVYSGNSYGHVAYVTQVYDEYMHIVENNATKEGKHEADVNKTVGYGDGIYLTGFIYVNEPKNKTSNSTSSSSSNNSSSTIQKSNNSSLKSLTIEGVNFEFSKDNYFYTLKVPYETDKVNIKGEAESNKAKIEGLKNYDLKVGENIIILKVTAEDKSESSYILNITREEEVIEKESTKEDKKENVIKENKSIKWSNYYLIPILVLVILLVSTVIIIIKRRKKK